MKITKGTQVRNKVTGQVGTLTKSVDVRDPQSFFAGDGTELEVVEKVSTQLKSLGADLDETINELSSAVRNMTRYGASATRTLELIEQFIAMPSGKRPELNQAKALIRSFGGDLAQYDGVKNRVYSLVPKLQSELQKFMSEMDKAEKAIDDGVENLS